MGLYNILFGKNPDSEKLLELLGYTENDCGRFRDVYIDKEGRIVIHTRNGGGNRDDYQDVFDKMATHPWHVKDEDDDFDCTYANIYFAIPDEEKRELISSLNAGGDPAKKWQKLFNTLNQKGAKND